MKKTKKVKLKQAGSPLRLFKPYVSPRAIKYVTEVLSGTQLAEGPQVKLFEREFAKKFGFKSANTVAVNSGTTALELAYELAGIKKGDEVITPILTCTATNLPLVRRRAKIIFADIDKDLNVDIKDVEKKITPRTKAIVFVHFGGNNRGLKEIIKLGKKYKIKIIEDAAQAVGSDYWGKADFICVSLQAIKILTSGDGGFLICKNSKDAYIAKKLRWFGYDRELKQKLGDTDLALAGYKYHMNDIAAAIGRGNLAEIDKAIARRKKIMAIYNAYPEVAAHIWLATVIGLPLQAMDYLKKNGIDSGQYHYRNDKYTIFGGRVEYPMMDKLENQYFILPFHHDINPADARRVLKALDDWKKLNGQA